jgi:hypothetical protein
MSEITQPSVEEQIKIVRLNRITSYREVSDPLFFGWQRGENTEKQWLDSIKAIKDSNPYPTQG